MKPPKTTDASFAAIRSFMWHYKGRFIGTAVVCIFSEFFIAMQPYFLGKFAASINNRDQARAYIILFIGSGIVHGIFWGLNDFYIAKKIFPLFHVFKRDAFSVYWKENYTTFIEKPSGKVGYYINQFPYQLGYLYDSYHFGFMPTITSCVVYAAILLTLSWQSAALLVGFLAVTLTILSFYARIMIKAQRKYTDEDSSVSGRVFDSYANFVNVFSFRAHHKEVQRMDSDIDAVVTEFKKSETLGMGYWAIGSFLLRCCLWPSLALVGWLMYESGQQTFAALVISLTVLLTFTNLFWQVIHHMGAWKRTSASYREAYEYLFDERNMPQMYFNQESYKASDITFDSSLVVADLSFAYPDAPDHPILKNINFEVKKNEKIGIVGKSGSGKSTLVKILLGFYDIEESENSSGAILVDGVPTHSSELSQLYAYVPQDTTLFQESIFHNIAYAKDTEVTLEQVKDVAEKAHIAEFIESLPNTYDTLVGERGVKLSLGQRQRIAIARAFLKQSDLLILDEATSALDSRTESYVQESFEKLWDGKSVIAIAHRLSTLNNVDRIIVMSKGEIVEQGTKEELLALDGTFADLWNHQRKGMI